MIGFFIIKAARLIAVTTIAVLLLQPVSAQESAVDGEAVTEIESLPIRGSQSGYEDIPEFGGPEAVSSQLKKNDDDREFVYQFDTLQRGLEPYFDWKRSINDEHGLSMGFSYYLLYQQASESLASQDDDALGSIFRYQGNWTLFRRDNGNLGRIEWRVESRSNIGGFQAPGSLGGAVGVAALAPGFAYSDNFDLDLAIINWTQAFSDGTAGFAVGRLAFDVYLDAFPFQTFSRGFINRSFILNPTLPTTGVGALGAVVKGFVSDNVWVGAQIHDANATSGDFDFDTVQEGEWLKAVEIGYTPSFAQRKTHLVQFTYWEKDARSLAGVSKGSGWAVSAAYQISDRTFPFIRFGHSDGGAGVAAEDAISAGVEFTRQKDEIWTIGAGWAKPSADTFGPGLDNEMVLETSYKFQLSKNFSLTPDVQLVFNPANNPDESSVWVFGLRGILTL
jgi:porin